jgi:hypothetical protein
MLPIAGKRILVRSLFIGIAAWLLLAAPVAAKMDFESQPMLRVEPGAFSLGALPPGYSHLAFLAWPRLSPADQEKSPGTAAKFAQMFGLVLLADVSPSAEPAGEYALRRVAIGHVIRDGEKLKVVKSDSGDITFFARQVLAAGEKEVDKLRQVARYDTAVLFDAPAVILRGEQHQELTVRHFVWTSSKRGGLATALWLVDNSLPETPRVVDPDFVLLPEGYLEDRVLSVDPKQFSMIGIPGKTAFAMARLPEGNRVPFTPELAQLAALPRYNDQTLPRLAQELAKAIANSQ